MDHPYIMSAYFWTFSDQTTYYDNINTVQLNQYETAPIFFQSNQNLTWDCVAEFSRSYQFLHDLSSADQNKTLFGSQ